MNPRRIVAPLLVLALAACTTLSKVGPGPVAVNDLSLALDGAWNKFESGALVLYQAPGASEVWTAHGITLDVLAFYVGVADGETIGQALPRSQKKLPQFRAKMLPHEIVELFETVITQDGSTFKLGKLEPARFAGGEGFRFEYGLTRKGDSLAFGGLGYGAVVNGKLYLMAFSAPRSFYFPRLLPAVETAARSASVGPKVKH
jgi:hypothetical protein